MSWPTHRLPTRLSHAQTRPPQDSAIPAQLRERIERVRKVHMAVSVFPRLTSPPSYLQHLLAMPASDKNPPSGLSQDLVGPSVDSVDLDSGDPPAERWYCNPAALLETLPSSWSFDQAFTNIKLDWGGLCATMGTDADNKPRSIRSNVTVPLYCGIYYFEVMVLECEGAGATCVGYSSHKCVQQSLPGWVNESFGYHSDNGHFYNQSSTGTTFGPCFGVGDVIGAGYDIRRRRIFFTKNGVYLGCPIDFRNVDGRGCPPASVFLAPAVGFTQPGDSVVANFGNWPFVFDIDAHVKAEQERVWSILQVWPDPAGQPRTAGQQLAGLFDRIYRNRPRTLEDYGPGKGQAEPGEARSAGAHPREAAASDRGSSIEHLVGNPQSLPSPGERIETEARLLKVGAQSLVLGYLIHRGADQAAETFFRSTYPELSNNIEGEPASGPGQEPLAAESPPPAESSTDSPKPRSPVAPRHTVPLQMAHDLERLRGQMEVARIHRTVNRLICAGYPAEAMVILRQLKTHAGEASPRLAGDGGTSAGPPKAGSISAAEAVLMDPRLKFRLLALDYVRRYLRGGSLAPVEIFDLSVPLPEDIHRRIAEMGPGSWRPSCSQENFPDLTAALYYGQKLNHDSQDLLVSDRHAFLHVNRLFSLLAYLGRSFGEGAHPSDGMAPEALHAPQPGDWSVEGPAQPPSDADHASGGPIPTHRYPPWPLLAPTHVQDIWAVEGEPGFNRVTSECARVAALVNAALLHYSRFPIRPHLELMARQARVCEKMIIEGPAPASWPYSDNPPAGHSPKLVFRQGFPFVDPFRPAGMDQLTRQSAFDMAWDSSGVPAAAGAQSAPAGGRSDPGAPAAGAGDRNALSWNNTLQKSDLAFVDAALRSGIGPGPKHFFASAMAAPPAAAAAAVAAVSVPASAPGLGPNLDPTKVGSAGGAFRGGMPGSGSTGSPFGQPALGSGPLRVPTFASGVPLPDGSSTPGPGVDRSSQPGPHDQAFSGVAASSSTDSSVSDTAADGQYLRPAGQSWRGAPAPGAGQGNASAAAAGGQHLLATAEPTATQEDVDMGE
ncbi:hypothetical protein H696_02222 [Fonticula alba]|uniref:B30.2/SPRY domain-containing protein n=1 Tax=Fonticula alba TaxID=691883 RepID=A0A058ZAE5_FONAL|nr:hypothetical protein H696_02222 [Fonticula alba]KCV71275.1 hypothetical protein H696_02222 [Fonticula alba]|eukprot:XP_009494398.1 hypothetical protein H696_02222 [Fonticula alba]